MQGEFHVGAALGNFRHQLANLLRVRHAGGIGNGHAVKTQREKLIDQIVDLFRRDVALKRAAECSGDIAVDLQIAAAQRLHDFREALQRLRDGAIDVGAVVAFRGRAK